MGYFGSEHSVQEQLARAIESRARTLWNTSPQCSLSNLTLYNPNRIPCPEASRLQAGVSANAKPSVVILFRLAEKHQQLVVLHRKNGSRLRNMRAPISMSCETRLSIPTASFFKSHIKPRRHDSRQDLHGATEVPVAPRYDMTDYEIKSPFTSNGRRICSSNSSLNA